MFLQLVVDLQLIELVDPVLSDSEIFDRRVRRVLSELCVRLGSFDLRAIDKVVVRFDVDKLGVLHQRSLECDFKVLSVGTETS